MNTLQTTVNKSPIDATEKKTELSSKYSFINTRRLLDICEGQGFKIASVKFPKGKNSEHNLHQIRLDLPEFTTIDARQERPQLIIQNAHNGTSSLRIMAGVFRMICSNGLVAGDTTMSIRLRHVGLVQHEIEEQLKIAAEQVKIVAKRVEEFKARQLNPVEVENFVYKALALRAELAGLTESEKLAVLNHRNGINAALLNRAKRREDQGNGLWETLNRVQENVLKYSGVQYLGSDGNYHRLGAVTQIQNNTKLNQQLWELAEKFAV